jgi:hypothetical protein
MTDIVERLKKKTRRHVRASMPAEATFLDQMDLVNLLIEYRTWRGQFIAPVPRAVHRSDRLLETELPAEQAQILEEIVAELETGEDQTGRLSSSVQRVPRPGRGGATRRDHLLSDWGVHHLHLSRRRDGGGFLSRTDDVLLAVFTGDAAYLIGIFGHPGEDNWAAREIFATVVRNWPDAGLAQEMKGGLGLSREYTDADHEKLRKAGLAGPIEVDGKIWVPRGIGQTLAGTPIEATREAQSLMWAFKGWKEDTDAKLAGMEGARQGAYWLPWIDAPMPGFEEYCGFRADETFVTVGRIC